RPRGQARAPADLDQRDGGRATRHGAVGDHRPLPPRAAWLLRLRVSGPRPGGPLREHQHEPAGVPRPAEGPAPGERRSQRHRAAGLLFGGPTLVITDLAEMDFHPRTRRMRVRALQPGASLEQVRERTGFDLEASEPVRLAPPTEAELAALRSLG